MRNVWKWLSKNRRRLLNSMKLEVELEPRMAHVPKLLAIALDGTDLEIENRGRSFAMNQVSIKVAIPPKATVLPCDITP